MESKLVREKFIEFFKLKNHKYWPSSSVVPHEDASLLFINAGMCQFKKIFLGDVDKKTEFGQLKRVVNSQKCIRAGGKHNDLEDVGKDVYHHTFFEMLGNWSFGDYFKEEAIKLAWECLTEVFKLDKNRLYVTYFEGDSSQDLIEDLETKQIWLKYLDESHIIKGNTKDNFWEMGSVGPCGPCTEIHYDRIGDRNAAHLVNKDDPNVLEIWNIVFIELCREEDSSLIKLMNKSIDTGLGFERIVSVLNNVNSNYDTDLFIPYFETIKKILPNCPRDYEGKTGTDDIDRIDMSYRILADHIRTLVVALSDDVVFSNEGQGYVLRRILRRAVRYGRKYLKAPSSEPWFYRLAVTVANSLGDVFPNIKLHQKKIVDAIIVEENLFQKSLEKGTILFMKKINDVKSDRILSGKVIFELYTVFGFPVDLIEIMCEEVNVRPDLESFKNFLIEHQQISSSKNSNNNLMTIMSKVQKKLIEEYKILPTEDDYKYKYDSPNQTGIELKAKLLKIIIDDCCYDHVDEESKNNIVCIITDRTCFYANSGGQVGDVGFIKSQNNTFRVTDTLKFGLYVLHIGYMQKGEMNVGDDVDLFVDYEIRSKLANNHTATHCLNSAILAHLNANNKQCGSCVESDKLKLEYKGTKKIDIETLKLIENHVNDFINKEMPVYREILPLTKIKTIPSLQNVPTENYPDPASVISVGYTMEDLINGKYDSALFSVELCGGTHVANTKEMKKFIIIAEDSVSKGQRRITAITSNKADEALSNAEEYIVKIDVLMNRELFIEDKNQISELSNAIKNYNLNLPLIVRMNLVERISGLMNKLISLEKAHLKKIKNEIIDLANNFTKNNSDSKYCIQKVDIKTLDFKILDEFVNLISTILKIPIMIINLGSDSDMLVAAQSVDQNFKVDDWLNHTFGIENVKFGNFKNFARGKIIGDLCNDWEQKARKYVENRVR